MKTKKENVKRHMTYSPTKRSNLKKNERHSRYNVKDKEDQFLRCTFVQVIVCAIIFVSAFAIKQIDNPTTKVVKDSIERTLNASTKMEDIMVFFSDMGEKYGEVKQRAVEVFAGKENKEDTSNSIAAPVINSNFSDVLISDNLQSTSAQTTQDEPRIIQTFFDIPLNQEDTQEITDSDTGEIRKDFPSNISLGKIDIQVSFLAPVNGKVSSDFGFRDHPITGKRSFHYGIDIGASTGTNVKAAAGGTVSEVGKSAAYGNYLVIDHGNGINTFYGHCSKITVKKGANVKAGDTVAKVGSTGISTGPHLHFEIRSGDTVVNPQFYIRLQSA